MGRHNFKKLKIWHEGMSLTRATYQMERTFPDIEKFNLVTQLTRCSVSIPSNIAEGTSKRRDRHFCKYLDDSLGSAFEWETQLVVAYTEGYITEEKIKE